MPIRFTYTQVQEIFTKKKFVFTDLDRKIAYSSGITILTTDINLIQTISDLFNKFNMKS